MEFSVGVETHDLSQVNFFRQHEQASARLAMLGGSVAPSSQRPTGAFSLRFYQLGDFNHCWFSFGRMIIINHPAVITIFIGGINHSQIGGL